MTPDEPLQDQLAHDPQSWNLYSYVRNNPLSNTDPTGSRCVGGKDEGSDGETCAQVEAADAEYRRQHRASATVTANDGTQDGRIFMLSYMIGENVRPFSLADLAANGLPYMVGGYGMGRAMVAAPALIPGLEASADAELASQGLSVTTAFNVGKGLTNGETTGMSKHALNQVLVRGVTRSEIEEALTHVPKGTGGSVLRFIGTRAEVRVNQLTGKIVTLIRFSGPN